MTPPVPLQFLVGLTRMISLYFGLRSLDGSAGAILTYAMQYSAVAEGRGSHFPSVWAVYFPVVAFHVLLAVLVWVVAPTICRFALRTTGSETASEPSHQVCWNEVMIFLAGTLFAGWGLARIADKLLPLLSAKLKGSAYGFSNADAIQFLFSVTFIGLGGVMMARFPSLYRWMQKRSMEQKQSMPAAGE